MYDFSRKPELTILAQVIGDLHAIARPRKVPFFLIGAAARDLMLEHAHGIHASRKTEDVDFAVMMDDWASFESLRDALIAGGAFSARSGPASHRLKHYSGAPLDIVPFGGIERADRTIAWPPDQHTVFDCFGASEAFAHCVTVLLPGAVTIAVASIPSLVLLKIAAWHDRKNSHPGKDAGDLLLYLEHYLECGNQERAFDEHMPMFEAEENDYVATGARLLGHDLASFLDTKARTRILDIIAPQVDLNGALLLAGQSGRPLAYAAKLLAAFCRGLRNQAAISSNQPP